MSSALWVLILSSLGLPNIAIGIRLQTVLVLIERKYVKDNMLFILSQPEIRN